MHSKYLDFVRLFLKAFEFSSGSGNEEVLGDCFNAMLSDRGLFQRY